MYRRFVDIVNLEDEVGSVEVSEGRDVGVSLRPDRSGGVVVKWLGAGVVSPGDEQTNLDDGKGVASGDVVGDAGSDADAPRRLISRLTIRAAVGSEDRKGDVIDPSGWELDGYRRNPVFLWAHDRSKPPIGKSQRLWVEDGALYAVVEFAPTDFAREIAELYERGFMRGVSVGFLPLETEFRQASNGRRAYLYRRQELLEISAVPVPMHDDALAARSADGGVHPHPNPLPSREREGSAPLASRKTTVIPAQAGNQRGEASGDDPNPSPSRSEGDATSAASRRGCSTAMRDVAEMRDDLRRLRVAAETLVD